MIVKLKEENRRIMSKPRAAGHAAEERVAFYLNRDFGFDAEVFILNDLRIVAPNQKAPDGGDDVAQIDHLVLHRWGTLIIESKAAKHGMTVRDDGGGGDEWTRGTRSGVENIPSPIQQARRQGVTLRSLLQESRTELLGRMPVGLRTVSKLLAGTDQRGFQKFPIQIIVAIADESAITRENGWKEPSGEFRTFVCKADLVSVKIREEVQRHRSASGLSSTPKGEYGIWQMEPKELESVAHFLASQHRPKSESAGRTQGARRRASQAVSVPSGPSGERAPASCKHCRGSALSARSGKYGYYWKCLECNENTKMPTDCSACRAAGNRGKDVRIRKERENYFRECKRCGYQERIWTETGATERK